MIHWTKLALSILLFGLGVLVGTMLSLPFTEVSNLVYFLVGLAVGVLGIVATFWVADRDRQSRLDQILGATTDIRTKIGELDERTVNIGQTPSAIQEAKAAVDRLAALVESSWGPALNVLTETHKMSVQSILGFAQSGLPPSEDPPQSRGRR